jgi:hypothetical protein
MGRIVYVRRRNQAEARKRRHGILVAAARRLAPDNGTDAVYSTGREFRVERDLVDVDFCLACCVHERREEQRDR